jgi:predicted O-methyltransferase YrrM
MDAVLELTQGQIPGWMPLAQAEALYVLVRHVRPSQIVETGVGHGMSTTFILQALEDNNSGHLHSIDVPITMRVDEHPSGCLVPNHLHDRWDLILGESKTELPPLLSKLDEVDIFLHDSDHSSENMDFEYREAWPHVAQGGLMLTDDIGPDFVRFGDRVQNGISRFNRMGGLARK